MHSPSPTPHTHHTYTPPIQPYKPTYTPIHPHTPTYTPINIQVLKNIIDSEKSFIVELQDLLQTKLKPIGNAGM